MAEARNVVAAQMPRAYAAQLTSALAGVLGRVPTASMDSAQADALDIRLTAAYLHGSAVLGGWLAERSDVDILFVVADDAVAAAPVMAELLLNAAAGGPGRGLECSVVTAGQAARPAPP